MPASALANVAVTPEVLSVQSSPAITPVIAPWAEMVITLLFASYTLLSTVGLLFSSQPICKAVMLAVATEVSWPPKLSVPEIITRIVPPTTTASSRFALVISNVLPVTVVRSTN